VRFIEARETSIFLIRARRVEYNVASYSAHWAEIKMVRNTTKSRTDIGVSLSNAATLARMFHEWHAATADMTVLPGVLGCRTLLRTVQVRLGSDPPAVARWHSHLHGLETAIHKTSWLLGLPDYKTPQAG
jgi:hypothetical protein